MKMIEAYHVNVETVPMSLERTKYYAIYRLNADGSEHYVTTIACLESQSWQSVATDAVNALKDRNIAESLIGYDIRPCPF